MTRQASAQPLREMKGTGLESILYIAISIFPQEPSNSCPISSFSISYHQDIFPISLWFILISKCFNFVLVIFNTVTLGNRKFSHLGADFV